MAEGGKKTRGRAGRKISALEMKILQGGGRPIIISIEGGTGGLRTMK